MRVNDVKAPRLKKKKYTTNVITNELWKQFKEKYPEYSKLTCIELNSVWAELSETIREETVKNPLGVKLGSYTGELKVQFTPNKIKTVNYHKSNEEGETINNLNIVTRGKVARVKWERRWAVKFNKTLQFLAFVATRDLTVRARKHIQEHPNEIRVARNTLGGHNVWRQLRRNDK